MDDFEALVAIVAGGGLGPAADDELAADPQLEMLVALAAAVPAERRKHEQRSWQATKNARDAKRQRKTEKQLATALEGKRKAEDLLQAVGSLVPHVARSLGVTVEGREMTAERAEHWALVATKPTCRGDKNYNLLDRRAVWLMAETLETLQTRFSTGVLGGPPLGAAGPRRSDAGGGHRHISLSWQWDETTQRVRNLLGKRLQGERLSHAKAATQVLMQTGRMCVSESNGCDWARTVDEPILSRATFLATTSADCILEAILRRYPIPLDDAAAVSGLGGSTGSVVLAFSHDRAASNYVVLRWICSQLILPAIPRNIYPHAEACVLHGLQLVRTRPAAGKPLIGAAFSLTRFFRNWKSMAGMRSEIIAFVRTHLEVVLAPCPEGVAKRDEAVLKILFGDRPAPAIGQPNRVTQSELKFREDLQAVVRLVPLSRDGLRHNCPPADVPVQPGVLARKPGCKNREDSVEKVTVALLNLFVVRSWVVGTESRWTHSMLTLARLMLGYLLFGLLPECLDSLLRFWKVPADLEAQLAALLGAEAHRKEEEAPRQLRLLRITRVLCTPSAAGELAVLVTGLRLIDDCMYYVFGSGLPARPTLLDLLSLKTPRFAELLGNLSGLLRTFGPDSPQWNVLRMTDCDFRGPGARQFARRFVLQLLAALFDHFVLKWSEPPYSLLPLLEPGVPAAEKRRRSKVFYAKPEHCCSLFLRRLRGNFPAAPALMTRGVEVLRSWNENQPLGIDYSEKAHYALRLQLRSAGRAKNATRASNKVFVQEAVAEHSKRHGRLPAQTLAETSANRARGEPLPLAAPARPGNAGNAQIHAANVKMKAFKALNAPTRPLTDDERKKVQEDAKKEWNDLSQEDRGHWLVVHRAALVKKQNRIPLADAAAGPPSGKSNIWGGDPCPASLVPAEAAVSAHNQKTHVERERLSIHDPSLLVGDDVPARIVAAAGPAEDPDPARAAPMHCCWEAKKNVCRCVLRPELARRIDTITDLFKSWVRSLGDAADDCSSLALLRGSNAVVGEGPIADADVIVLLALRRQRPVVQVFARCCLVGACSDSVFACPPPPFRVEIRISPSRLCSSCLGVELCTSDELALELARLRLDWSLIPLSWAEVLDVESLLVFAITSLQPPLVAARAPCVRRPRGAADLLAVLGSLGALEMLPPEEPAHPADEEEIVGEDEGPLLAGYPADFVGDVAAELAEEFGVNVEDDFILEEALQPELPDEGAAELELEAEHAVLIALGAVSADAGGDGAGEPAAVPAASAAAFAVVDANGGVTCPLEPWCQLELCGTITTWPKNKPLIQRNVSIKCKVHSACKSKAGKRAVLTDAELLAWLFSGTCEPFCTLGRSNELANEHEKLWWARNGEGGAAASSSSGSGLLRPAS